MLVTLLLVVRYHNVVRGVLSVPRRCDRPAFLDRVHEFGAEPVDLRVLQPRLPRSFQEYSAVRVLLALQTRAVRSRGARFPSAVPKVRSGLTRRGTTIALRAYIRRRTSNTSTGEDRASTVAASERRAEFSTTDFTRGAKEKKTRYTPT